MTHLAKVKPISKADLQALRNLDKNALIQLILRVSGAMWGVALLDEFAIADALLLKLARDGLNSKKNNELVKNIKEWIDLKRLELNPPALPPRLERLEMMDKKDIITMIRRVSWVKWEIGMMNDEEIAEAMVLKLAATGLESDEVNDIVENIMEWISIQRSGLPPSMTLADLVEKSYS